MNSLRQYFSYMLVGGVVGACAVIARQLGAYVFPDTRFYYVLVIVLVYGAGIVLSYLLQKKHTFRDRRRGTPRQFLRFWLIAAFSGCLTALLSYVFRYGLALDSLFGTWSPTIAFTLAVLLTSLGNFFLNRRFVFGHTSLDTQHESAKK